MLKSLLLSGLEKILSAIAEMRNKGSDSHGVGETGICLLVKFYSGEEVC